MNKLILLFFVAIIGCTHKTSESNIKNSNNEKQNNVHLENIQKNLVPIHYLKEHADSKSITQMMVEEKVPGVSIAFIENGKIAWQKSYGYANLQDSIPVTPNTLFNGASLSKPIAAMTALNLVEKGYINLNDDVNIYLKNWKIPNNKFTEQEKVTLKRLIGHTAGINNYVPKSYSLTEEVPNIIELLSGKKPSVDTSATVVNIPGKKQKYSNPGYSIIQKLIEDVSDKKFELVTEELVFKPSGMYNSSFEQPLPSNLLKNTATGYSNDLTPYPYKVFPWKAAGGIWTTPTDLGKFLITLLEDYHSGKNVILSKKMADSVFQKTPERLGFGKLYDDEKQDLLFEHWGSNSGFTCYMVASLNKKQGVVIMNNSDNGTVLLSYIARAVAQEYNWDFLQPTVFETFKLPAEKLNAFVGTYTGGNAVMEFKIEDDHLILTNDESNNSMLIQVGENKFILPENNNLYEFLKGKNNKVNYVRITNPDSFNNDYRKQEE